MTTQTQTKTMPSKNLIATVASLAFALAAGGVAQAGRGGSADKIESAARNNSPDAVIAELERAELKVCDRCIDVVRPLLDHQDYRVREAAAWWFARRPSQARVLAGQAVETLTGSNSVAARNAADMLGTFRDPSAIPALSEAAGRQDLDAEARHAAVRALGVIAHRDANPALAGAMSDPDASVRRQAVIAWRDIRGQVDADAAIALIADSDTQVRREAAALVGGLRDADARAALESQLASDSDPAVRRNAAWALGRIGNAASRTVLETATNDPSGLVRATARAAIRQLH